MHLKVCGMRDSQNIRQLAELKPDYMGFIFYEKTPRNATEVLEVDAVQSLPSEIKRTGVFVNAETEFIQQQVKRFGLHVLQLHGNETVEQVRELKELGRKIIKVFSIGKEAFDFDQLEDYKEHVDFFLFDTKGKSRGGNGEVFNWEILDRYDGDVPYFLSGGIDTENVEKAKELKHQPYAIDVNSKFEIEPGLKNIGKVKELVTSLRGRRND